MGGRAAPGSGKRRRWAGLRQKWKLLGLFEIDQHHEFYTLTRLMKEGLATTAQDPPEEEPPAELSDDDYRSEVTETHQDFTMKTFAGPVFASLRSSLGMTEQEYCQSLCSENFFLQFISNSKSKADFFLTNDKRFFLKTQNKREVMFLLDNLKNYVEHLRNYPHTLLVKFLGVHRIIVPHRWKKYFVVMMSVFYPDERISARYDIKGCEVSRWTDPAPEGSQHVVVLKDLNFEGQTITLAQQRSWLLLQMEIDTRFLQRLNVLDYSFLLAQQNLQPDEQLQVLSLRTLIIRTKRSVNPGSSSPYTDRGIAGPQQSATSGCPHADHLKALEAASEAPGGASGGGDDLPPGSEQMGPDFRAQNRRLLPNLKYPLHVIDGPEQRYFMGIIDIFTVYTFRKRLEHLWKRIRHPGRSFSTVSPQTYCLRLCDWIRDHTK